jgi:hypothetical protein
MTSPLKKEAKYMVRESHFWTLKRSHSTDLLLGYRELGSLFGTMSLALRSQTVLSIRIAHMRFKQKEDTGLSL